MRDLIGNKLIEGALVHWNLPQQVRDRGLIVTVAHIDDARVQNGDGGQRIPSITLTVRIPLAGAEKVPDPMLSDFLVLQNPQSQGVVERLMEGDDVPARRVT